jgi:hypothetical protein
MLIRVLNITLAALIAFLIVSCKKDTNQTDFHEDYFPLNEGHFVVYDVVEINHDVDNAIQHDTMYYQLKTVIGDTVIDNLGRVARKYLRYKRVSSSDMWELTDVWTAILDGTLAELTEENQRIIKLILPPTSNKEWNPNSFTVLPELEAYYVSIHKAKTLNSLVFDSTLTVEQEDFFSMVDYRRKYEVYAKNIGLVKKVFKDLIIAGFDKTNVQKGKELELTCIAFGVE